MTVTRSVTRSATRSATYGATVGKWGEPAWMRQFQTSFDFVNGIYRLNNRRVPLHQIDGYHARASARRAEDAAGVSREFANGVMARTDRGYDSREGWTNLLGSPTGTSDMSANRGTVQGGLSGPVSNDAVLFTCGGNSDPILYRQISGNPSGKTYTFSMWIRVVNDGGHALKARFYAYGTTGVEAVRELDIGVTTSWQRYSWTTTFPAGMASTGSIWRIDPFDGTAGTNKPSAGSSIMTDGWQVTETPYVMPFGVGTVAPDSLVIPAADAGLAVDPSVTGLTMVWRGRDFQSANAFARFIEARADANNRFTLFRGLSGGGLGSTLASGGPTSGPDLGTLAQVPRDAEFTAVATWRADGAFWAKAGAQSPVTIAGRPMLIGSLTGIGVSCDGGGGAALNAQIRLAAIGAFSLSDADALALFNQVAAS